jgi:Xaa-Pro aminopeptidase
VGIATESELIIFADKETCIEAGDCRAEGIEFVPLEEMRAKCLGLSPKKVSFDPSWTTHAFLALAQELWPKTTLDSKPLGLVSLHADKNKVELSEFAKAFDSSDRAIWRSLNWLKDRAARGEKVSERDFKETVSECYREEGMVGHSFNTISAFGSNGSIIHYGKASPEVFYRPGDLALLDSGAYYHSGLATDCTRTILASGTASAKQIAMYTAVLKGLLRALYATFDEGTPGKAIDALARGAVRESGFEYAHGTGHGIGVNVHEGCYSLTPTSEVPMVAGRVGSIEPGVYLPGEGGVRLENAVVVEPVAQGSKRLRFRSLVFIGFDHGLIAHSQLSSEERNWLRSYEEECARRGRLWGQN